VEKKITGTQHKITTQKERQRDSDKGRESHSHNAKSNPVQSSQWVENEKQKKFQSPSLKNKPIFTIVKPPFVPHYNHLFWPVLQLMKAVKLK
jgi:hypothetical protein